MRRTRTIRMGLLLIAYTMGYFGAAAQKVDTMGELHTAYAALKNIRVMGYKYTSDIVFPNGNTDRVNGSMYIDYGEKYLYNDCSAYTMIFTRHVFYKADHRKHEIMFTDLNRNYDKRLKRKTEQDIFEDGFFEKYSDTSVLRKAIFKEVKINSENILSVSLLFPANSSIKSIHFFYDRTAKLPTEYDVELYQPTEGSKGKAKGITVKIKCTGFSKRDDMALEKYKEYFLFAKGKLQLKKYTGYKLSSTTNKTI